MRREKQQDGKRPGILNFKQMQAIMALFILLTIVLYLVAVGIRYDAQVSRLSMLTDEEMAKAETLEQDPMCLLLWDDSLQGTSSRDLMMDVLEQMRVPAESRQAGGGALADLSRYDTVVLTVSDLNRMGEDILELLKWAEDGGKLMFFNLPDRSGYLDMIAEDLGIVGMGSEYALVEALHFPRPFMLGGELRDYGITDPYESSIPVLLDSGCEVYLESAGEDHIPLIWRRPLGQGTVVVSNLGFVDKVYRGFYGSAYSLLGDAFAWPAINGSTFYIDDFPAPVPQGDDTHISSDYNMSVRDFMTQVWWTDVQNMAEKHGVRYTGMVIEQYSDKVKAPLPSNEDISRYHYFGKSLLDMGGEIGFHGYNHMPLVLKNFDYMGEYDEYKAWASMDDMIASITELDRFCASLFPNEKFQVYVPPSNILSPEGRAMLHSSFPQIKVIASTYLPDDCAYDQEFEVAEDGMVETPRVISGYIMSDFVYLAAMSELSFRFVNTHFQHPDDVLDEDRGADLGWAEMSRRLSGYMDWLYTATPSIRNLTGIELAGAVQRYDALQVSQSVTGKSMTLDLGGFVDEAWLFVRLNGKTPGAVEGGELEQLQDGLYLLHADSAHVTIPLS